MKAFPPFNVFDYIYWRIWRVPCPRPRSQGNWIWRASRNILGIYRPVVRWQEMGNESFLLSSLRLKALKNLSPTLSLSLIVFIRVWSGLYNTSRRNDQTKSVSGVVDLQRFSLFPSQSGTDPWDDTGTRSPGSLFPPSVHRGGITYPEGIRGKALHSMESSLIWN